MKVRSEASQTGMATRRATGGFRRWPYSEAAGIDSTSRIPTKRNAVDMPGSAAAVEAS
jgi:hypothetical protein